MKKIFGTVISDIPQEQNSLWIDLKNDELRFFNGEWKPVYSSLFYRKSETYSKSALDTKLNGKEDKSNKVTSISASSTDTQYPSAKCVYDAIQAGGGGGGTEHVLEILGTGEGTWDEMLELMTLDGGSADELMSVPISSLVVKYGGVEIPATVRETSHGMIGSEMTLVANGKYTVEGSDTGNTIIISYSYSSQSGANGSIVIS